MFDNTIQKKLNTKQHTFSICACDQFALFSYAIRREHNNKTNCSSSVCVYIRVEIGVCCAFIVALFSSSLFRSHANGIFYKIVNLLLMHSEIFYRGLCVDSIPEHAGFVMRMLLAIIKNIKSEIEFSRA